MPDQPLNCICPNCGKPCGKCGIKNHRSHCDWHKKYQSAEKFNEWVTETRTRDRQHGRVW